MDPNTASLVGFEYSVYCVMSDIYRDRHCPEPGDLFSLCCLLPVEWPLNEAGVYQELLNVGFNLAFATYFTPEIEKYRDNPDCFQPPNSNTPIVTPEQMATLTGLQWLAAVSHVPFSICSKLSADRPDNQWNVARELLSAGCPVEDVYTFAQDIMWWLVDYRYGYGRR